MDAMDYCPTFYNRTLDNQSKGCYTVLSQPKENRKMTNKDYIALAHIFECELAQYPEDIDEDIRQALKNTARGISDIYKKDNPNFDREQFMTACGFR
jgi:hypothetical protein